MRKLLLVLALAAPIAPLQAQQTGDRFPAPDSGRAEVRYAWRPLRIAKWTTLLVSGGAAAYGFTQNRSADRDYEQLERECEAQPVACLKGPDGEAYANANMEARYQRIVERDDRARVALLGGQLGIAAAVVLFIVDLPDRVTPEDIPYQPKPYRINLRRDGSTELQLSLRVPGW